MRGGKKNKINKAVPFFLWISWWMHFVCVVNTVMSHEGPAVVHSTEVFVVGGKKIDRRTQQTIQPNAEQTHERAAQAAYKPAARYDSRLPVTQVPYRSTNRTNTGKLYKISPSTRGETSIFSFLCHCTPPLQHHKADFNLSGRKTHGGRSKTGRNNVKE